MPTEQVEILALSNLVMQLVADLEGLDLIITWLFVTREHRPLSQQTAGKAEQIILQELQHILIIEVPELLIIIDLQ